MVHADTNGLMDKCHCGAVAGFEHHPYECRVRARCIECCEQTEYQLDNFRAAHAWNLARRAEKEKDKPANEWVAMIPRKDETTCKTCNGYGGLMLSGVTDGEGLPLTMQCPDCRAEDDKT